MVISSIISPAAFFKVIFSPAEDILKFVESRKSNVAVPVSMPISSFQETKAAPVSVNGGDEIVEMDRMRKLISGYMMASINTSAHVQSFIEVDVTNIWKWREKNKNAFNTLLHLKKLEPHIFGDVKMIYGDARILNVEKIEGTIDIGIDNLIVPFLIDQLPGSCYIIP